MDAIILKARQFWRAVNRARCADDLHQLTCPHCGFRLPGFWLVGEGSQLLGVCPNCLARVAFGIAQDRLAARVVSCNVPIDNGEHRA
jgi:hypothetical protein